jgi:hypothetical protein
MSILAIWQGSLGARTRKWLCAAEAHLTLLPTNVPNWVPRMMGAMLDSMRYALGFKRIFESPNEEKGENERILL